MPLFGLFRRGQEDQRRLTDAVAKARQGWLARVTGLFRQPQVGPAFWDELEEALIVADVGVGTTQRLLQDLRQRARSEGQATPAAMVDALKAEMVAILSAPSARTTLTVEDGSLPKPQVVLVVGVNGAGKTTSIAKLAYRLKAQGRSVLLGAADTYRAAAIEQLQVWAQRVGVEVIAHQAGSDPGGVAYDAVSAARARGADILILDTAGRLHTRRNLMEELQKVSRVVGRLAEGAPHEVLLVLDGTTGQNGLLQARTFTQAIGCTGVFLAKMDGTARGGIVLAIAHELGLPILFVGTGEGLDDMAPFAPEEFVEALFAAPAPRPLER